MRTLLYYELKKIFGIRRTLILSGAALLVCLASYWFTCLPTLLHSQFDVQRIRAKESALSSDRIPAEAEAAEERRNAIIEDPASYVSGVLPGEEESIWDTMKPERKEECERLENVMTAGFVLRIYDSYTDELIAKREDPALPLNQRLLLEEEIAMRQNAGTLQDGYNAFYYYMILFFTDYAPLLLGFVIIVLLSPVFIRETASRTDSLILSSRCGKSGVILAKFLASLLAVTMAFACIIGFYACLVGFTYGFEGGRTSSLFAFTDSFLFNASPFHFTMAQLLGILLAVSYAGCLGLASLILFLSSHLRSGTGGIVLSFTVYYLPLLLYFSTNSRESLPLGVYFYSGLIQAVSLFRRFDGWVLFGRPVWSGYLALGILALLTLLALLFSYHRCRRQQAGN